MSEKNGKVKIEPLGARVLVRPVEAEGTTPSGILLPETAKEKPQMGVVVAVGDDDETINVGVDDRVLYPKYAGTEVKFEGVEYLLMESSDILARVLD